MKTAFDWYDSGWLRAYNAAIGLIAEVAPSRLEEFARSFDIFRTDPNFKTRHLPALIDEQRLERIRTLVRDVSIEKLEMHEMSLFGRIVVHDIPELTAIQDEMLDEASTWAGEPLESSYHFVSLYTKMGECRPHLDSPKSKWTLDLCLDQSEVWPLHIGTVLPWPTRDARGAVDPTAEIKTDRSLGFSAYALNPGDAAFFSGSSQWHYRDPMPANGAKHFCDLLFLHYIPKGTAELVRPANWAALFDIPEMAQIDGIEDAR